MFFHKNQAHHVKWVIALGSSYRALVFYSIWLEENKSSCPLIDVWFNVTLHHRPIEILEMVIEHAKMLRYDVMMVCACMHKQVSVYIGKQYSHKAHKALGLGLHEVWVLPS